MKREINSVKRARRPAAESALIFSSTQEGHFVLLIMERLRCVVFVFLTQSVGASGKSERRAEGTSGGECERLYKHEDAPRAEATKTNSHWKNAAGIVPKIISLLNQR